VWKSLKSDASNLAMVVTFRPLIPPLSSHLLVPVSRPAEAPSEEQGEVVLGLAECAQSAAVAASALLPLLPLILPEESVDRGLEE
jgi:hypothetical protein